MTPNPLDSFYDTDPNVEDVYPLDPLNDGFVPPGKASELIQQHVNQRQCEKARIVKLTAVEFSLRWEERHPELPSAREHLGEAYWYDRGKRLAYQKLYDLMPSKRHKIPLSRQEAFALVAAVYVPDEFQPETDALWG